MSTTTIDPVCLQVIFQCGWRGTLLYLYHYYSIKIPKPLFAWVLIYSELNGGYVGDTIVFFRNRLINLKSCICCKHLTLDFSQLGQILTWYKNMPPIASTYCKQSTDFFFLITSMTFTLEVANGDCPPPLFWTVENGGVAIASQRHLTMGVINSFFSTIVG